MSQAALLAIYIPFLIIAACVFILEIIRLIKTKGSILFVCMIISVIGWNISMLSVMLVADIYRSTFLWNIAIVFVGLATTIQFLIVYRAFRPEVMHKPLIIALFFLLPALNAVVVLTPALAPLMRQVELANYSPEFYLYMVRGPWFWVHTIYSYIIAVATVWALIKGHLHKPRFYRLSSSFMAIGLAITLLSNLITLARVFPTGVDITALAAVITIVFLYMALSTSDHSLFARYARSKVFGYMEDFVLVLGQGGHITDFNPSAKGWFSSLGIDLRMCTLDGLLDKMISRGATITESPEGEEGRDIFITDGDFPLILNLRTHKMIDEKRFKHGYVAFFVDVTHNRALLDRLEKQAGVDALTGLPNRIAYDGAKNRYNKKEHLPLSVIMCDLNGLKQTNDTLGHRYGDMMLQTVSTVLNSAHKRPHFVARIGGDEFIFLLSCVDEDYANNLIKQVKDSMDSYKNLPFRLSLAMGAATKHNEADNIEDIVALADARMYEDKKRMKEGLSTNGI